MRLFRECSCWSGADAKDVGVGGDLVLEAAVVADGDDAVAAVDQLPPEFNVAGGLGGLVVDGAVAKDADVRGVEEVRDAARLGDGLLRLVGLERVAGGQGSEETALNSGPRAGQGPQPGRVGVPIAPGDAREGAASGEVEQLLPEAMAIQNQGLVLVAEAHEAFVAGGEASRALVSPGGVKLAPLQGLKGQASDGVRLVHEPAQRADTAFA